MTNNKHVGFPVVGALLVASASVWTIDRHHPTAASQPSAAIPAKTAPATASSADTEKRFERARQQMKKMQVQMDRIHQTKDPKGRQRLMAEHVQAIQDAIQTVHDMGGPMMMDMMGGQGMGVGGAAPMTGGSGMPMEQHMNMMENRMDMVQMMMNRMLKQQEPSKRP